jgi:Type I phosphodiesterase / nucleotide pyrophosphatase
MRSCLLDILILLAWVPCLAAKPLVVLVSIDGFRPDYLKRGNSATLDELAERGASAKGLLPAFPSVTFPNHYSIVTGLVPDHHGIVNNTMFDPTVSGRPFSLAHCFQLGTFLVVGPMPTPEEEMRFMLAYEATKHLKGRKPSGK